MLTCGRAMMTGWLPAKDTDAMGPGPGGLGSYPGFAIPIDMASSQDLVVGSTKDAPVPALTLLSQAWLLLCPELPASALCLRGEGKGRPWVALRFPVGVRWGVSANQAPQERIARGAACQDNCQRQTPRDYDICRCAEEGEE